MKVFLVGGSTVSREATQFESELANMAQYGRELGKAFAKRGHELVVCSPFEDSLDYHAVIGVAEFCQENEKELAIEFCLLYTSPSPRDGLLSRMPSSA